MVYFEAGKSKGVPVSVHLEVKPQLLVLLGALSLALLVLYWKSRRV